MIRQSLRCRWGEQVTLGTKQNGRPEAALANLRRCLFFVSAQPREAPVPPCRVRSTARSTHTYPGGRDCLSFLEFVGGDMVANLVGQGRGEFIDKLSRV